MQFEPQIMPGDEVRPTVPRGGPVRAPMRTAPLLPYVGAISEPPALLRFGLGASILGVVGGAVALILTPSPLGDGTLNLPDPFFRPYYPDALPTESNADGGRAMILPGTASIPSIVSPMGLGRPWRDWVNSTLVDVSIPPPARAPNNWGQPQGAGYDDRSVPWGEEAQIQHEQDWELSVSISRRAAFSAFHSSAHDRSEKDAQWLRMYNRARGLDARGRPLVKPGKPPEPGVEPVAPSVPAPVWEEIPAWIGVAAPTAARWPTETPAFDVQIRARPRRRSAPRRPRRPSDAKVQGSLVMRAFKYAVRGAIGTPSEIRDLVQAMAWNIVRPDGTPVLMQTMPEALAGVRAGEKIGALGSIKLEGFAMYRAFDELMEGRARLDIGGFLFDAAANQLGDLTAAAPSMVHLKMVKGLGYDLPYAGPLGFHQQTIKDEGQAHALELPESWRHAVAEKFFWSASWGVSP